MEINGVVDGTHMVINPVNKQAIGCHSMAEAVEVAKLLGNQERATHVYKFVMAGNAGGWLRVWTYRARLKTRAAGV